MRINNERFTKKKMNINEIQLWKNDIEEVITTLPELEKFLGQSILITGSTGLICSSVVDVLIHWNERNHDKINILVAGRDKNKIISRYSQYIENPWFSIIPYNASNANNSLPTKIDYIIHGASNASPNHIVDEPVETMLSNFLGTRELLEYCRINHTKRFLFISSSEVYGKKSDLHPSKEDEYGGIDILKSRSSYSVGKCASETLCASYYDEYGVESSIIRPGHIYGPTAMVSDNRVSSAWAYNVAKGENIVMKSNGSQIRSYCYCLDSASAILQVLLKGESVKAYNISNPESVISIKQMAELLVKSANVKLEFEIPTEFEKKGFNPMSNSSLDSTELQALGWKGLFNAERGFSHTVEILRQLQS